MKGYRLPAMIFEVVVSSCALPKTQELETLCGWIPMTREMSRGK